MLASSELMEKPSAIKPLSSFLSNVLRNGTITLEQAILLNTLSTPHLQYDAVLNLRRNPEQPLDQILLDVQSQSSCKIVDSPAESKRKMSNKNKRWIDIAVLSLAIPMVHMAWGHWDHLGAMATAFLNSGIAQAQASRTVPLEPVSFKPLLIQTPIFIAHKPVRPASVKAALNTMMDEPERTYIPDSRVSANLNARQQPEETLPTLGKPTDWAAEEAAELAASEAMPITSRR
jgi:hypothetical protein